jgi:hypothetical protein
MSGRRETLPSDSLLVRIRRLDDMCEHATVADAPGLPSDVDPGLWFECRHGVLRCHKAKPFAQVDGLTLKLPPPNTVTRLGTGDR